MKPSRYAEPYREPGHRIRLAHVFDKLSHDGNLLSHDGPSKGCHVTGETTHNTDEVIAMMTQATSASQISLKRYLLHCYRLKEVYSNNDICKLFI